MFICYIYRHLCFDNVYMPIKNLNLNLNLNFIYTYFASHYYVTDKASHHQNHASS